MTGAPCRKKGSLNCVLLNRVKPVANFINSYHTFSESVRADTVRLRRNLQVFREDRESIPEAYNGCDRAVLRAVLLIVKPKAR